MVERTDGEKESRTICQEEGKGERKGEGKEGQEEEIRHAALVI